MVRSAATALSLLKLPWLVGRSKPPKSNDGLESPFFSVIVPTYNRSHFILPTIRSALWQTYQHFEVLVIGDGCSDDTGALLQQHFGRRVTWHNLESNRGSQSYPNNEGIRRARGSHVAYLGHDDIWSPDHLSALASVIANSDPDFVVSGAVIHKPVGAGAPRITGLVVNQDRASRHFFPPSSFAHRRGVLDSLGGWPDPNAVVAPVDCHLLLSARKRGMSFAATDAITVHKFAAGHRYLSYLFPSDQEQEQMMQMLGSRISENRLLTNILIDSMAGFVPGYVLIPPLENFSPGDLHRESRAKRGLDGDSPIDLSGPREFISDDAPGALDWHPREDDPDHGPFRWSGPNPNPLWFINARCSGPLTFVVTVLGFAEPEHAKRLRIEANDVDVPLKIFCEGGLIRFAGQTPEGPVTDGLKLRFRTSASVVRDGRKVGFRLHKIELLPLTAVS